MLFMPDVQALICRVIALLLAIAPLHALARTDLSAQNATPRCKQVQLESDQADCDNERCRLQGHVILRCEALTLWADRLDIALLPDQSFGGAHAYGNVVLVDGKMVVTCPN